MQAPYYDRDGRPVSQEQWQQLGRQPGYSRIGYHDAVRHGQQVTVITFWSGIAGHGPDGPLIFCTCASIRIPGGPRPAFQRLWGWPDIAAARAGHQAARPGDSCRAPACCCLWVPNPRRVSSGVRRPAGGGMAVPHGVERLGQFWRDALAGDVLSSYGMVAVS
jgi:hypothetical protein